jgi:hypothetical protein
MNTHSMTEGAPWKHIIKFAFISTKALLYNRNHNIILNCSLLRNML